MGYTRELDTKKYESLQPWLEKITDLKPWESLRITGLSRKECVSLKWLLYNWMHHAALKEQFTVKTEVHGATYLVRVLRKGDFSDISGEIERPSLPSRVEEVVREMIKAEAPSEVLASADLNTAEAAEAIRKYEEIMEEPLGEK